MTNHSNDASPVDGFSESWLTLREPFDHSARSDALSQKLHSLAQPDEGLNILDLGCGTGSNLRYLLPRLGHRQHWTLVDNDSGLLATLPSILTLWAKNKGAQISIDGTVIYLQAQRYSAIIDRTVCNLAIELPTLPLASSNLVTGSALLDLTSAAWLDQLARLCVDANCAALFVLNYDGRVVWRPSLSEDNLVLQQLNEHQLRDKGFGAALGPNAAAYFTDQLEALGRSVLKTASDWKIPADSSALQHALLEGWAPAAIEQSLPMKSQIEHWRAKRMQHIEAAGSNLQVGHLDILSLPD